MARVFITAGMFFGDEGKGKVVDSLVRRYGARLVVRYNGGSQAAHTVAHEARVHTFHQFGSGTFVDTCRTLLSKHVFVNPLTMQVEEAELQTIGINNGWNRMNVDERALITTPFHRSLNRLREYSRGTARHGSCGMGVGETWVCSLAIKEQALRAGDLRCTRTTARKLAITMLWCSDQAARLGLDMSNPDVAREMEMFRVDPAKILERYKAWASNVAILNPLEVSDLVNRAGNVVFEGAQGVLLDQTYGFNPYTTWSNTTMANAFDVLAEAECRLPVTKVGVIRTYTTRHGPGPFPTYAETLTKALPDRFNTTGDWQQNFRCGWLDLPLLEYAICINGDLDCLAITHCDKAAIVGTHACVGYSNGALPTIPEPYPNEDVTKLVLGLKPAYRRIKGILNYIKATTGLPVLLTGHGPLSTDSVYIPATEETLLK